MLFLITLALAVITTAVNRWATGKWLTLASLYWLGWLGGIPAAELAGYVNLLPPIDSYGERVILLTHYGASIGFIGAALISVAAAKGKAATPLPRLTYSGVVWLIVGLQALLGLALLASRIGSAGLDLFAIRSDYLDDAYLTDDLPPQYRLYSYVSLIALIPSMMIAAKDRQRGRISWQSLGLLFLAAAPGGLSTGGRVWVLQTVSTYFISYIVANGPKLNVQAAVKRSGQILLGLVAVVGLFTAFGNARDSSRGQNKVYPPASMPNWVADQVQAYSPLIMYMGVPTSAAGPYSQFNTEAYSGTVLNGQMTFPFLTAQEIRLGLVGRDYNREYTGEQRYWVGTTIDHRIGTTHATLAPLLVADFGEDNLLLSSALVFFAMQLAFIFFVRWGGVWHLLATLLALYGGVLIFQDASFGTAAFFLPALGSFVAAVLFRKNWHWGNKTLTQAQ